MSEVLYFSGPPGFLKVGSGGRKSRNREKICYLMGEGAFCHYLIIKPMHKIACNFGWMQKESIFLDILTSRPRPKNRADPKSIIPT